MYFLSHREGWRETTDFPGKHIHISQHRERQKYFTHLSGIRDLTDLLPQHFEDGIIHKELHEAICSRIRSECGVWPLQMFKTEYE